MKLRKTNPFPKLTMMISTTPLRSKILCHTRSSSLPSRSHPLIPQFNDHLQRLQPPTPSFTKKLTNLDHLYNCVDDLLLLHHTQQVFARESHEKWVQQVLDGYLSLVDACATAKDFISLANEHVLDLLSTLRRRRDSDDLSAFFNSRKTAKKMIHKSLRNITALKNRPSVLALDRDQETIAVISMLREAESATLDLIESLLFSLSGAKSSASRLTGWPLISRLVTSRRSAGQDDRNELDFGELDATLYKILSFRTSRCDAGVRQQLKEMDQSLRLVEEKLENLFKRLIKTRVSLLNMHSY